ncbi:IclR family transcriptional regulator domain-containing protein [Pseudomonas typographi]|uniref:IclR family transcriptional regulator domain-containing protein n=1 Tax=Pseudomonas typographi TaxID=2715964 RepID=UPI001EEEF946|nr:IclR family transcriptional regulator C-terminal domain-containing protein [Pseudomonas typographi]
MLGHGADAAGPADEQPVAHYVAKEPIKQYTRFTLTDLGAIQAEIARARACGYAICDPESDAGGSGVSAPVFDAAGACDRGIGYRRGVEPVQ